MRPALALLCVLMTPTAAHAYGEPDDNGRPGAEERFLLALTNEIRQDPHGWPGWDTSLSPGTTLGPVAGLPSLFEAARFHADDMASNNFFEHESSDGTPFASRVSRFFNGPAGENLYFATWNDPYDAMTGWMNSDGHRRNILTPDWTWLGVGYAKAGSRHYYVQNFGRSSNVATPAIPAAGARRGANGDLELVANYFDDDRKAPLEIVAAVDGACTALGQRTGRDGHSTHAAIVTEPTECVPLVFTAEDADGVTTRYPSTGAYLVGTRCTKDFDPTLNDIACGASSNPDGPLIIDAEAGGCRCAPHPSSRLHSLLACGLALVLLRRRRSR